MTVEHMLEQIDSFNKNYEWVIKESERILSEINALDNQPFNADEYEILSKQLLELQTRYKRDKQHYTKTITEVRHYFEDKHGIDIMSLLDDSIDEVK